MHTHTNQLHNSIWLRIKFQAIQAKQTIKYQQLQLTQISMAVMVTSFQQRLVKY